MLRISWTGGTGTLFCFLEVHEYREGGGDGGQILPGDATTFHVPEWSLDPVAPTVRMSAISQGL